ncbi:MAG: hypothetical protein AMS24_02115 [Chlamydiae bacterium SM23_39]|nr:MAG: hypothetical protein AMS24_02115 [Chlamydiae bacterium SM23_39]
MVKKLEKLAKFFIEKRYKVFIYLFFVFVFCFLLFGKLPSNNREILDIEKIYFDWEKSGDKKLFVKLDSLLKKWPYLSSKYQTCILQKRINEEDKKIFKRVEKMISKKDKSPTFSFSKITLFVLKNDFQKALLESKKLKKSLEDKDLTESSIYSYTLIRNAFLEKKLKHKKEELESLLFLEKHLEKVNNRSLIEKIEEKNFPIRDYIAYRKKKLSL